MAVREVVTDPKTGKRISKFLPEYKDKEPEPLKEKTTMAKTIKAQPVKTDKLAKLKALKEQQKRDRSPLRATIMSLNGMNYVKKSQEDLEEDAELLSMFKKWLSSGEAGEFFAIRRK